MAKELNKILVADLEATCWESPDNLRPDRISEIIEIGYALIDMDNLHVVQNDRIWVKPQLSEISEFCTKMTGIMPSDVENGVSFSEACDVLRSLIKTAMPWASYGDYDRRQIERQCKDKKYKARYPFGVTHINVKNIFAVLNGLNRELSMDKALEVASLPLIGRHHSGKDDALNIAAIFLHLIEKFRLRSDK